MKQLFLVRVNGRPFASLMKLNVSKGGGLTRKSLDEIEEALKTGGVGYTALNIENHLILKGRKNVDRAAVVSIATELNL